MQQRNRNFKQSRKCRGRSGYGRYGRHEGYEKPRRYRPYEKGGKYGIYGQYIKRALDVALSAAGLLFGAAPMLLIALAVKGSSRGPVFFSQKRVGIHRTYFQILKFRTMYVDTPANMPTHQLAGAEHYLTPVGRILRESSLDELPQLWNILKGDMSFVGPRPALWNQYDLLAERERYGANDIKPGLTGWAQVHGRDELEIPEKARLDGIYAKWQRRGGLRAFLLDCTCIAFTIRAVLKQEGIVEGSKEQTSRTDTQSKTDICI